MSIICLVTFSACWEQYLKQEHSCYWLQVYSIVEIRTDTTNALAQLSAYVSWIFMECIDWLFVIVFTLNDWLLRMHLFDHSRIVSSGPINIHNVSSRILSMVRQEWWHVPRSLCISLLPLLATPPWHWNSLAGIHWLRFGMVIMLFHCIGPRYSSFHQLTMCLGSSLHSAPSKSQRANIDQWQCYVMIQCLTVRKSNNCDRGCVTGRLGKKEWKSEIFVVGQVMCWTSSLSGSYLCYKTIVATTLWTWQ